jgi:prepilin-type processing-associated H-X9-DG protein
MTSLPAKSGGGIRWATTLLELVVAVAILATLIGLLLPAVQRAREAAARMACASNLRQLGLALHQSEARAGHFPPGAVEGPFPPAGVMTESLHGCGTFLLPYLEQTAIADRYHWDVDFDAPPNWAAVGVQVKVLQCPAAPPDRVVTFDGGGQGACIDYGPVFGAAPGLADLGLIDRAGSYQGVLARNVMNRVADITDGTSNTLLFAEDAGLPMVWRAGKPASEDLLAGSGAWASSYNFVVIRGSDSTGVALTGPCGINCTNLYQPYSFHPRGANFLFADGSVHFLRTDMDIRVLAALATRAGGEVVSSGDW